MNKIQIEIIAVILICSIVMLNTRPHKSTTILYKAVAFEFGKVLKQHKRYRPVKVGSWIN